MLDELAGQAFERSQSVGRLQEALDQLEGRSDAEAEFARLSAMVNNLRELVGLHGDSVVTLAQMVLAAADIPVDGSLDKEPVARLLRLVMSEGHDETTPDR
jgi:hypothetical protein